MTDKKFLDSVYELETVQDSKALYGEWSKSYEAEVGSEGYATPGRIASALKQHVDTECEILDYGCGTGLAGMAMRAEGFANITGWDITPEMLSHARDKAIYKALRQITPDQDLPAEVSTFQMIVACGVIGAGAAPAGVFDQLMHAIKPHGMFCFSYNDHTLADQSYTSRLNEWIDCGAASLLFQEHGDHLPGKDMKSTVYILRKA